MFHNLGADREKARSAVLLSALEIVFGTNKEILFRERRPGREGTWRRISSDRYVGALSWTHLKVRVRSKGEKFIFNNRKSGEGGKNGFDLNTVTVFFRNNNLNICSFYGLS